MRVTLFLFSLSLAFLSCRQNEELPPPPPPSDAEIYFPPIGLDDWETQSPESLNWNADKVPDLLDLLEDSGTRAFLLLKDGKIVIEAYFGKDLLGIQDFDKTKNWYWASAAKTLKAFTVGKAEEEGFLTLDQKSSDFLGEGWTSLTAEQESKITVWHQMTMTSGLDDGVQDVHNFESDNLFFKADPNTRWAYHNAPYTLLEKVVSTAVEENYDDYFNTVLRDKIGMDGNWLWSDYNHLYFSTARSMARYGLLVLNNGKWDDTEIINSNFVSDMTTVSQDINKSYGYLWWLNGKESYLLPGLQLELSGSITPNAPADMFSGIGKDAQYLSVVPSQNLVMVRMGENPDGALVPVQFMEDIWDKLNDIIE